MLNRNQPLKSVALESQLRNLFDAMTFFLLIPTSNKREIQGFLS